MLTSNFIIIFLCPLLFEHLSSLILLISILCQLFAQDWHSFRWGWFNDEWVNSINTLQVKYYNIYVFFNLVAPFVDFKGTHGVPGTLAVKQFSRRLSMARGLSWNLFHFIFSFDVPHFIVHNTVCIILKVLFLQLFQKQKIHI